MSSKAVQSPCINVCRIKCDICIGCGRTLEQISSWLLYTDEQKSKIIEEINGRKNSNT
jgi:predicted Fe-S protein YdhL (DUF1289 family)